MVAEKIPVEKMQTSERFFFINRVMKLGSIG